MPRTINGTGHPLPLTVRKRPYIRLGDSSDTENRVALTRTGTRLTLQIPATTARPVPGTISARSGDISTTAFTAIDSTERQIECQLARNSASSGYRSLTTLLLKRSGSAAVQTPSQSLHHKTCSTSHRPRTSTTTRQSWRLLDPNMCGTYNTPGARFSDAHRDRIISATGGVNLCQGGDSSVVDPTIPLPPRRGPRGPRVTNP